MTQDSKFAIGSILFIYGFTTLFIVLTVIATEPSEKICWWLSIVTLITAPFAVWKGYKLMDNYNKWCKAHPRKVADLKGFIDKLNEEHKKAVDDAIAYPSESNRVRRDTLFRVIDWLRTYNIINQIHHVED